MYLKKTILMLLGMILFFGCVPENFNKSKIMDIPDYK